MSSGWRDKERRFFGIPDEEELGASTMIYTGMVGPRLVAMLSILLLPKSILCLVAWSPLVSFYFLPSNLPNLPNPKRYFRCSWVVVLTRLGPSESSESNKFLLSLDSIGGPRTPMIKLRVQYYSTVRTYEERDAVSIHRILG